MITLRHLLSRLRHRLTSDHLAWSLALVIMATATSVMPVEVRSSTDRVSASRVDTEIGEVAEEKELIAAFERALRRLSRSLLTWIGEQTDYEVDALIDDPPHIVFALVGDTLDFDGAELFITAALHGAYVRAGNTIVLVLPWHIDDLVDRSILLHELSHTVQFSARDWKCLDETEWEAHQLQRRWLAEHDIELQLDWILIGILSHCHDPDAYRRASRRPSG